MDAALTIDARALWAGEEPLGQALAFVDLDTTREAPDEPVLPPCPVIGLGARDHPFAHHLDAIIEPPVTAQALARQVLAMPGPAAVIAQLLRFLPQLEPEAGLAAESLAYGLLQGSEAHREWIGARSPASPAARAGRVELLRDGEQLLIALDRPECGNAIDRTMRDALYEGFSLAANDPAICRVVLRGKGRTFCLGADLDEFGTTRDPATAHAIRARTLPARALLRCADRLEAHVQGACVGAGLEIAAFARRLTAASDAWFQLPELAMGILPGAGGCVSLSRRIGRQRAALLILSGKRLSARQALGWGLIDGIMDEPPGDECGADQA